MPRNPIDREAFFARLRPGQLLGLLFASIPGVYFFVKDRNSRFVSCSPDFARAMGAASPEELIGGTDHDFAADFLADAFIADDRQVMETGRPIIDRVEMVPTEDSLDWLCTTKIPLYGNDGAIVGLAGITRKASDSDDLYRDHPEMHAIVDFIRGHYREKITIRAMAEVAGISVSTVDRLFRRIFGITPAMYARKIRLNAACREIRERDADLATIARDCGFSDPANMTRAFRSELKITPKDYRRRFKRPQTSAA